MKKIILLLAMMIFTLSLSAQKNLPSYIDVIKNFCTNYIPSEDYENYTVFAKKKDGWYILQVNKLQADNTLREVLYYSYKEAKYHDLGSYYDKAVDVDMTSLLKRYLLQNGGISDWYKFERVPYYGYNGWCNEMIDDFSNRQNMSDTMYDAIGRAYANLVFNYLWYQNGGMTPSNDTLFRKLGRLEYPSSQRISKIKEALDSCISKTEQLSKINPSYKTIVGNSTLNVFNDYMLGYNQMLMCGKDELAKEYLEKAPLAEAYILQAKNYLNSCEPNAILFTYGDNDTYQLWYVQGKFNFRKDVLVINNSLLGIPVYIDMIKRKKLLTLSIANTYLQDQLSDVAYYVENKKEDDSKRAIPLKKFLNTIYTKKFPQAGIDGNSYSTYPYLKASLTMENNTITAANSDKQKSIVFNLNKTYFINDIAMFDIIANNINTRPVYFTSTDNTPFENNTMQRGIVYKLIAGDINSEIEKNAEIRILEKFIKEKYVPVLSNGSTLISTDGDNTFFALFYKILNHYLEKKDIVNLKSWLKKLETICPEFNSSQINVARSLAYYFIEAGNSTRGLAIIDQYARWLNNVYTNPNSLTGYYFKENYISELTKTRDYLATKNLQSTVVDNLLKQ
ncbi:MAG: hypothetical protein ABI666_05845 [Ferruginibacter sp.]